MKESYISKNLFDTENLGKSFAKRLKKGDVVALTGCLGAGKTALAKAIAKGLGINSEVSSPTFNILKEYSGGRLPLYHFDIYRVNDPAELFEIGFFDYLEGSGVCLIEWADLAADLLPAKTIHINIEFGEGETERRIDIEC